MHLIAVKKAEYIEGADDEDAPAPGAEYPAQPPPPGPPAHAKTEIYKDPTVFAEVGEFATKISVNDAYMMHT